MILIVQNVVLLVNKKKVEIKKYCKLEGVREEIFSHFHISISFLKYKREANFEKILKILTL